MAKRPRPGDGLGFIIMNWLMDDMDQLWPVFEGNVESSLITGIAAWHNRDPLEIIEWLAALHRDGLIAIVGENRYALTVEGVIDIVEMREHRDAWYQEHPTGEW